MAYTYEQLKEMEEQQIQRCVKILDAQAGLPPNTTNASHRQLVEAIISATLLSMSALQAEAQQRHGAEGE